MYSIQYQDNKVTSSSINTVCCKEKLASFAKQFGKAFLKSLIIMKPQSLSFENLCEAKRSVRVASQTFLCNVLYVPDGPECLMML